MPFFQPGPAPDPAYALNRDHESRVDVRVLIETLWSEFEPLCGDRHFVSDARAHFGQRVWELMVFGVLREHAVSLLPGGGDGPDLRTVLEGRTVWIEAVAPMTGSGEDAATRRYSQLTRTKHGSRGMYRVSHERMLLRYISALSAKASLISSPPSQYRRFLERGAVGADDGFVIAIGAGAIPDADMAFDGPTIIRALFPVGEPVRVIEVNDPDAPARVERPYRGDVSKASGAQVATTAFVGDEFENVSAVLFCPYGVENAADCSGRSYVTVHNPRARVPLPRGAFRFGREYWIEPSDTGMAELHHTDWRGAPAAPPAWSTTERRYVRRDVRLRAGPRRSPGPMIYAGQTVAAGPRRGRWVFVVLRRAETGELLMGWLPKKRIGGLVTRFTPPANPRQRR